MPDIHETVARHETLWEKQLRLNDDQERVNTETAESIRLLKDGQERIVDMIGDVPTRKDFYEMRAHFDTTINGVLREAIAATPKDAADRQIQATRAGNVWLAVAAVAAVCGLVVSLLVATVTITARNEQRAHVAASQ